ncbi:MAG: isopentenyl phosphate kinase family protein [Candidatus Pacebacteria bacterium]|nr:isopentenyl phosphate kinase family protein [Candidatus Paceibacterota bacterium]
MKKNNLIILKIGGSVITDKKNDNKKINRKILRRISREIAWAQKEKNFALIIVHGVGPFGHKLAKKFNLHKGYKNNLQIKALSEIYESLQKLNTEIGIYLKKEKVNTVSFKQSSAWMLENKRLINADLSIIKKHLDFGIVPILHGDVLMDTKLGFSVLSGDQIVSYLAKKLTAKKVVVGTDVDGVFNNDPKLDKHAKIIKMFNSQHKDKLSLGGSISTDVTGGMKGKIDELIELSKFGIESEIINIAKPNILKKSLYGKNGLGTIIK